MVSLQTHWEIERDVIVRIVASAPTLEAAVQRVQSHTGLHATPALLKQYLDHFALTGAVPDLSKLPRERKLIVPPHLAAGRRELSDNFDVEDTAELADESEVDSYGTPNPISNATNSDAIDLEPPKRGLVTVVSDIHIPFHDPRKTALVIKVLQDLQPDYLVLNGDVWDNYKLRKGVINENDVDPDKLDVTLAHEFDVGRPLLQEMCRHATDVRVVFGNHEYRMYRMIRKIHALHGVFNNYRVLAGLPNHATVHPYMTRLRIGDVNFTHGDLETKKYAAAATYAKWNCSMVVGHTHRPDWFQFRAENRIDTVCVAGCLIGRKHVKYTTTNGWGWGFVNVWYDTTPEGRSISHIEPVIFQGNDLMVMGRLYR